MPRVELHAGHSDGSQVVHLTARFVFVDALCGETIQLDGEPDLAAICEECDRLGRESGGDPDSWFTVVAAVSVLRVAA